MERRIFGPGFVEDVLVECTCCDGCRSSTEPGRLGEYLNRFGAGGTNLIGVVWDGRGELGMSEMIK